MLILDKKVNKVENDTDTEHKLHQLALQQLPRNMKQTMFHNTNYKQPKILPQTLPFANSEEQNETPKHSNSSESLKKTRTNNKVINDIPPKINTQEQTLFRYTRKTLAQLKANKCPLLMKYLHKISPDAYPTPACSLCNTHITKTISLYVSTCNFDAQSFVGGPWGVADFLTRWPAELGFLPVQLSFHQMIRANTIG